MASDNPAVAPSELSGPAPQARTLPVTDRGTVHHEALRVSLWKLDGIAKVDRAAEVGRALLRGTAVIGGQLHAGSEPLFRWVEYWG